MTGRCCAGVRRNQTGAAMYINTGTCNDGGGVVVRLGVWRNKTEATMYINTGTCNDWGRCCAGVRRNQTEAAMYINIGTYNDGGGVVVRVCSATRLKQLCI